MPMFDFCGAVRTDLGTFELPHTTYISVLDEPRLELKQSLRDGCRYLVRLVGPGDLENIKPLNRIPIRIRISKIYEELDCD